MKSKTKTSTGFYQSICDYLTKYAYVPEMKADGTAFEKRKIESAVFNTDKSQLLITGAGPELQRYTLVLKDQRKVYSRTDREYDKLIIRGLISLGEDYTSSDRQKLIVYLKGYPANAHVSLKLKNALSTLIDESKKE
jgi:hypothetical protein